MILGGGADIRTADGPGSDGDHNRLWKLAQGLPPIVMRDSVLLVEERGVANAQPFPPDFTAENVSLVWLGSGPYPFPLPPGVTVTTDPQVWEEARTGWLTDHGYPRVPDYPGLGRFPASGDSFVELTWRLGSGAESYRVKRSATSGGPYDVIAEVGADAGRSFVDTNVESGTRYYYVVTSINPHGESARSNEVIGLPVADSADVPSTPFGPHRDSGPHQLQPWPPQLGVWPDPADVEPRG